MVERVEPLFVKNVDTQCTRLLGALVRGRELYSVESILWEKSFGLFFFSVPGIETQ